jgi:hypothetical protein
MSQYVAKFSSVALITTHSRTRTTGTPTNRIPLVVSIVSLSSPRGPRYGLTPLFYIDTPEVDSGSLIGPSSTYSLSPSSTGSPTPLPRGRSSDTGAIAGGVAGGIAAITIVIVAIFYLRRRSQATSAVSAGFGASQSQQSLSDESVPPSSSGSPMAMRFYVRDFVSRVALVCSHVSLPSYPSTHRTRMTELRSRGTKVVRRVRTRRTTLIKHLCHRTSGLEAL